MDDHVIGVKSRADGLRLLGALEESLSNLYLTPNAKKSIVLSLPEAKLYFHLDTNAALDLLETKVVKKSLRRQSLVRELSRVWRIARRHEGKGQWGRFKSACTDWPDSLRQGSYVLAPKRIFSKTLPLPRE
jgi:hypothetical protein